jgi:heme/copper-type cytochrome/quinol oxidase subunit 3
MALLIAGEATFFGCLIATYFYLRFNGGEWPPAGIEPPSVALPLVLAAGLLASCVPLLAADRVARAGLARRAWLLVALAAAIQATCLGIQIELFSVDLGEFSPSATAYGSAYFTLLGAHHLHVGIGLLFDAWLLAKLLGGLTAYRLNALRAVAFYWCFVALAGVLVVLTQLSPSL